MNTTKIKLVMIGGFCLVMAFFGGKDMLKKGGWPEVPAEVLVVNVECDMESTAHKIVYKTVSTATIPCELVDAFKTVHADKEWKVKQKFTGTLRVGTGTGADAVEATMELNKDGGREPQVGDKLTVVQNPASPTQIERTGTTGARLTIVIGGGLLGALLLYLAFKPRRRAAAYAVAGNPAGDAGADQRARQADALIAAALAKQATLPNQPARVAAAGLAREGRFAGQKTNFGRRN